MKRTLKYYAKSSIHNTVVSAQYGGYHIQRYNKELGIFSTAHSNTGNWMKDTCIKYQLETTVVEMDGNSNLTLNREQ